MGDSQTPASEDYVRFVCAKEPRFIKDTGVENLKKSCFEKIDGKNEIDVNVITDGIDPAHTLLVWMFWIGVTRCSSMLNCFNYMRDSAL